MKRDIGDILRKKNDSEDEYNEVGDYSKEQKDKRQISQETKMKEICEEMLNKWAITKKEEKEAWRLPIMQIRDESLEEWIERAKENEENEGRSTDEIIRTICMGLDNSNLRVKARLFAEIHRTLNGFIEQLLSEYRITKARWKIRKVKSEERDTKEIKCYKCDKKGHVAPNCPEKSKE